MSDSPLVGDAQRIRVVVLGSHEALGCLPPNVEVDEIPPEILLRNPPREYLRRLMCSYWVVQLEEYARYSRQEFDARRDARNFRVDHPFSPHSLFFTKLFVGGRAEQSDISDLLEPGLVAWVRTLLNRMRGSRQVGLVLYPTNADMALACRNLFDVIYACRGHRTPLHQADLFDQWGEPKPQWRQIDLETSIVWDIGRTTIPPTCVEPTTSPSIAAVEWSILTREEYGCLWPRPPSLPQIVDIVAISPAQMAAHGLSEEASEQEIDARVDDLNIAARGVWNSPNETKRRFEKDGDCQVIGWTQSGWPCAFDVSVGDGHVFILPCGIDLRPLLQTPIQVVRRQNADASTDTALPPEVPPTVQGAARAVDSVAVMAPPGEVASGERRNEVVPSPPSAAQHPLEQVATLSAIAPTSAERIELPPLAVPVNTSVFTITPGECVIATPAPAPNPATPASTHLGEAKGGVAAGNVAQPASKPDAPTQQALGSPTHGNAMSVLLRSEAITGSTKTIIVTVDQLTKTPPGQGHRRFDVLVDYANGQSEPDKRLVGYLPLMRFVYLWVVSRRHKLSRAGAFHVIGKKGFETNREQINRLIRAGKHLFIESKGANRPDAIKKCLFAVFGDREWPSHTTGACGDSIQNKSEASRTDQYQIMLDATTLKITICAIRKLKSHARKVKKKIVSGAGDQSQANLPSASVGRSKGFDDSALIGELYELYQLESSFAPSGVHL